MDLIAQKMEQLHTKLDNFTDLGISKNVMEVEPGAYECQSNDCAPVWRDNGEMGFQEKDGSCSIGHISVARGSCPFMVT